jgi:hypothetical protein
VPRDFLRIGHLEDFLRSDGYGWAAKEQSVIGFRSFHRWGAIAGYWPLDQELVELRLRKRRAVARPCLSDAQAGSLLASARGPVEIQLAFLGLLDRRLRDEPATTQPCVPSDS